MAIPTYLEMTNEVLVRLRESEVTSVGDNAYSKLIAKYINDTKRQVEDAYEWNALTETLTATTAANIFSYVLEGSGTRFRIIDVLNDTENVVMKYAPTKTMNQWFLMNDPQRNAPMYYNFNGTEAESGDTLVDFYPIPDGVYDIRINLIKSQVPLVNNSDKPLVPSEPIVLGAYARALAERGEDGGMASSEAYQLFKSSLADFIAIEAGHYPEETIWEAE
jgi:hypothetical protein